MAQMQASGGMPGGMPDLGENGDDEDEDDDGQFLFSFLSPLPFETLFLSTRLDLIRTSERLLTLFSPAPPPSTPRFASSQRHAPPRGRLGRRQRARQDRLDALSALFRPDRLM